MKALTKEQIEQMIEEIEEIGFYQKYENVTLNSTESDSGYSEDTAGLEADGFHTYHVHSGYGLGCFPVYEEYLGFFTGDIADEQLEEVSIWISQIHADMKKWKEANSKLGIDKDLIRNVRGMISYEIEILEDGFHPIFLDQLVVKRIYIGGYDDPSSYGSHESRYLSVDYINESWNQHIITDVCRGGNGRGCFNVWEEMYGIYYDSEYMGIVYNTLRKWKNMEREYFSSIKTLKVDYYDPQEDEIVILKNGVIKSSTQYGGECEYITVFVKFDRMSRSGNPVYKRIGDTLTAAIWKRWEVEMLAEQIVVKE